MTQTSTKRSPSRSQGVDKTHKYPSYLYSLGFLESPQTKKDEPDVAPGAGEVAPPSGVRESSLKRSLRLGAFSLTATGLVVLAFFVYEFAGSHLLSARNRAILLSGFSESLKKNSSASLSAAEGKPLALIDIPLLKLRTLVVEGSAPADLEKGVGHFSSTPVPGAPGNVVIAGRRTTFGAPFRHIDRLEKGSRIFITSGAGKFLYLVDKKTIVRPGKPDVVGRTTANQLSLVTSNPAYFAGERLAIIATLQGNPIRPPAIAGPVVISQKETGLAGDGSALGPLVVFSELLAAVLVGAAIAWRRKPGWAIYLLGAPVALAMMALTFEQLSRLLPATL